MISFKDIELKDKELITSYTQQSPRRNCDLCLLYTSDAADD